MECFYNTNCGQKWPQFDTFKRILWLVDSRIPNFEEKVVIRKPENRNNKNYGKDEIYRVVDIFNLFDENQDLFIVYVSPMAEYYEMMNKIQKRKIT